MTDLERDASIYYGGQEAGFILKADSLQNLTVTSGNSVIVYSEGIASDLNILSGGALIVEDGGVAESLYVNTAGTAFISSGASATVKYNPWSGTVIADNDADVTYLDRDASVYYGGEKTGFLRKGDNVSAWAIASGNSAIIFEGGVADDLIVNNGAVLNIQSGGSANVAYNPWDGVINVAEGGSVSRMDRKDNVYYGGYQSGVISRGNELNGLTVTSGNSAIVYSGGKLTDLRTDSYGYVYVSSGGAVENAYLSGGIGDRTVFLEYGGVISSAQVVDSIQLYVAGSAYDIAVNDGQADWFRSILVMAGSGYAENITIGSNGRLEVFEAAKVNGASVLSGGYFYADGYDVMSNVTVHADGQMELHNNASVVDLNVEAGGRLYLYDNVVLQNATLQQGVFVNGFELPTTQVINGDLVFSSLAVTNGASAELNWNQTAIGITVNPGTTLTINDGATAEDVIVSSGANLWFRNNADARNVQFASGATFNNITLNEDISFAELNNAVISGGKIVRNDTVWWGAEAALYSGQTASDTLVNPQTYLYVYDGAVASGTTVFGALYANNGTAVKTTVESGGFVYTDWSGRFEQTTVKSGGSFQMNWYGSATDLTIESGGRFDMSNEAYLSGLHVESGAFANGFYFTKDATYENLSSCTIQGAIVSSGYYIDLHQNQVLEDTLVDAGRLTVRDGAVARRTTAVNGGSIIVSSTGIADTITIGSGATLSNSILPYGSGILTLEGGARLYGAIRLGTNLTVNGAIDAGNSDVVLDLTKRSPEDTIMISDISGFDPNSWTIELALEPEFGTYILGGNAAAFAGTITVRSQNGQTFGSLSLADSSLSYDTVSYSLSLNEQSALCFTISSNIAGSSDGVFLYKNTAFAASYPDVSELTIGSEYACDHVYVVSAGDNSGWSVEQGGFVNVTNGGSVESFAVHSGGSVNFGKGGTGSGILIDSTGVMNVCSGGIVGGIMVESNGRVYVSEGGIVSGLQTNSYGYVSVFSGGLLKDAYLSGGISNRLVTIGNGGVISSAQVVNGVDLFMSGSAYDIIVSDGRTNGDYSELFVRGGGYAENVSVCIRGTLDVQDSGTVSSAIIGSGGSLYLGNSCTVYGLQIQSQGRASVHGTVNGVHVSSAGYMSAGNGGTINDILIDSRASANLNGKVQGIFVSSGGSLYMESWGAGVSGMTIESGAYASFGSGIGMQDATVKTGARIYVNDMASAAGITVESGANVNGYLLEEGQTFESGMTLSSMRISSGASVTLNNGQSGIGVTISYGGVLVANNGAGASDVTISSGARMNVNNGANTAQISVLSNASLEIGDGANADGVSVAFGGNFRYGTNAHVSHLELDAGARINNITLQNAISAETMDGFVIFGGVVSATDAVVYYGQVASDITILSGGSLTISSGASVNGLVVSSGARILVPNSATVNSVTVLSGAFVNSFMFASDTTYDTMSGFVVTGGTVTQGNANLYPEQGAVNTVVNSQTRLNISGGATASSTTVFGSIYVSSYANASETVVMSGGYAWTSRGAFDRITVNSGARLDVNWYGSASIVFNPWQGSISSYSYSTVTYLEREANVYYGGGKAGLISRADSFDSLNITSGNSAIVYEGGVVNSVYVNQGGVLTVQSGGSADVLFSPWTGTITVEDGAIVTMHDRDAKFYYGGDKDGMIFKTDSVDVFTVEAGNRAVVYAGGSASELHIKSGAQAVIESDGTADHVYVNRDGTLIVSNGAAATVEFNPWSGTVIADDGADVTYKDRDANVYYGGTVPGYIQKGDELNGMTVTNANSAIVYEGGVMKDATVEDSAMISIQSSGVVNSATVTSYGRIYVSSGGVVNNATVDLDGRIYVSYGGSANDVLINSAGWENGMYVSSRGTVNGATVNNGGYLYVSNGASAANIVENGGRIDLGSNAFATFASNTFSGVVVTPYNDATAHSGTTACGTIMEGGWFWVYDGGLINEAVIHSGVIYVSSGGTANHVVFTDIGGTNGLNVYYGGFASDVTVCSSGSMYVSSGGTATDIDVASGAILWAYNNVTVNNVTFESGAKLNNITLTADTSFATLGNIVVSGGIVMQDASLYAGHTASNTFVDSYGSLYLRNGAVASDTTVFGGIVVSNGTATNTVLSSGAYARNDGYYGTYDQITVKDGASFNLNWYCSATGIVIESGGRVNVDNSCYVSGIQVESGAFMNGFYFTDNAVYDSFSSCTIRGAVVSAGNNVYVRGGQVLEDIALAGGQMTVQDGGVARRTMVTDGGTIVITSTGIVDTLTIGSGAVLSNSVLPNGAGAITLEDGARLRGAIRLGANLTVNGAIDAADSDIVLALTSRTQEDGIMVSDISSFAPRSWTVEVALDQMFGTYVLGGNAADFAGTITVRSQNGQTFGELSLTESSFSYDTVSYALSVNDRESLCLTVSSNIAGNTDGVFLYKDGAFVASYPEISDLTVTGNGEFNHAYVVKAGSNQDWIVLEGGVVNVTGGNLESATIYSSGTINLGKDGTGNGISINSNGTLNVFSGGIADGLAVGSYGRVFVSEGGLAQAVDVLSRGQVYVTGGTVNNASVTGYGSMTVSRGGYVEGATVNVYGRMFVSDGGYADYSVVSGYDAYLFVSNGGVADHTTVAYDAHLELYSGAVANDTIASGWFNIYNGGVANNTTVGNGIGGYGTIISSGGTANGTTVANGGSLYISNSGSANGVVVDNYGYAYVGSGAFLQNATIRGGAMVYLQDATFVTNTTIESGAYVNGFKLEALQTTVENGMVFSSVLVGNGYSGDINKGQSGTDLTVLYGGTLNVNNGGSADLINVSSGANLSINAGANANQLFVSSGANLTIKNGANAENVAILAGANFHYENNVTVNHIDFEAGARINNIMMGESISVDSLQTFVLSGGIVANGDAELYYGQIASDLVVSSGARLTIRNGADVKGLIVSSGAMLQIESDFVAEDVTFQSGAYVNNIRFSEDTTYISMEDLVVFGGTVVGNWWSWTEASLNFGQTASDTVVDSYARLHLYNGATANDTMVKGALYVYENSIASETIVQSGGSAWTSRGAFERITVNPGGRLEVNWYGSASIVFNPWQGSISSNSYSTVTYLGREANVYYGGPSVGVISKADSFGSLNITSGMRMCFIRRGAARS